MAPFIFNPHLGCRNGLQRKKDYFKQAGVKLRTIFLTITDKLDFPDDHPMFDHYKQVA